MEEWISPGTVDGAGAGSTPPAGCCGCCAAAPASEVYKAGSGAGRATTSTLQQPIDNFTAAATATVMSQAEFTRGQ